MQQDGDEGSCEVAIATVTWLLYSLELPWELIVPGDEIAKECQYNNASQFGIPDACLRVASLLYRLENGMKIVRVNSKGAACSSAIITGQPLLGDLSLALTIEFSWYEGGLRKSHLISRDSDMTPLYHSVQLCLPPTALLITVTVTLVTGCRAAGSPSPSYDTAIHTCELFTLPP